MTVAERIKTLLSKDKLYELNDKCIHHMSNEELMALRYASSYGTASMLYSLMERSKKEQLVESAYRYALQGKMACLSAISIMEELHDYLLKLEDVDLASTVKSNQCEIYTKIHDCAETLPDLEQHNKVYKEANARVCA